MESNLAKGLSAAYNFFFHPLHESHTPGIKVLSLLTVTALSAITLTGFLFVVGAVNLGERCFKVEVKNTSTHTLFQKVVSSASNRIEHLKQRHQE